MILLGFDIEEFDLPMEYGKYLSLEEQIAISTAGTFSILAILKKAGIQATFYCTANYAVGQPDMIRRIVAEGHEVASHGYYHNHFIPDHLFQSKQILENISGTEVLGYRMARMMPVDEKEIKKAGYLYNSSINPTWLPGRYNNLHTSRTWFFEQNILQLPVSVSPIIRFPLFWLSFHHLPMNLINGLSSVTYKTDGYLNLYFHPWEFTNLDSPEKFGLPRYIVKNSGEKFVKRFSAYIEWVKYKGYQFGKTGDFAKSIISCS